MIMITSLQVSGLLPVFGCITTAAPKKVRQAPQVLSRGCHDACGVLGWVLQLWGMLSQRWLLGWRLLYLWSVSGNLGNQPPNHGLWPWIHSGCHQKHGENGNAGMGYVEEKMATDLEIHPCIVTPWCWELPYFVQALGRWVSFSVLFHWDNGLLSWMV